MRTPGNSVDIPARVVALEVGFGALQSSLEALAASQRRMEEHLSSQIAGIAEKVTTQQRANWPLFVSVGTFAMLLIGAIGFAYVQPERVRVEGLQAQVNEYFDRHREHEKQPGHMEGSMMDARHTQRLDEMEKAILLEASRRGVTSEASLNEANFLSLQRRIEALELRTNE